MNISIITPCSRPDNLDRIYSSFGEFPYHWYIVYDGKIVKEPIHKFENDARVTEWSVIGDGCMGNDQRNAALDRIDSTIDTMIYFLDDDTCFHPDLVSKIFSEIKTIPDVQKKIITFDQWRHYYVLPDSHILPGNNINLGCIDTGMCIIHRHVIGDTRWESTSYEADFYFIQELFKNVGQDNHVYLPIIGSLYNHLRYY